MSEREFGARAALARSTIGMPLAYAAAAVVLGMLVPRLETHFLPDSPRRRARAPRSRCSRRSPPGMLPLTGLVFSLAFVMVQFSATAYSPRLVSWFAGSAMMSHSLGVFTATFLYSLAAIVWVDRGGTGKVPPLTLWVAIAAAARERRVLRAAGGQARGAADLARPRIRRRPGPGRDRAGLRAARAPGRQAPAERPAEPGAAGREPAARPPRRPRGDPGDRRAGLVALAARRGGDRRVAWAVGDTLIDGMPLCASTAAATPLAERKLRRLVKPRRGAHVRAGPQVRDPHPRRHRDQGALAGDQRPDDRGAGARPGRGPAAAPGPAEPRRRPRARRLRQPAPRLPGAELGGLPGAGLRRDPLLRRELDPGHAPHAGAAARPDEEAPAERRPALERYLERVDNGIRRAFEDGEDRKDALEQDRQGLGLSPEQRQA